MADVNVEHGHQKASNGKQLLKKDDLYFNDMDIRAWERRTAALGGASSRNDRGYQEDEGYHDDSGGPMSAAEYEELLFQRVLDKIRLARAADVPDVQLTPEELDAYRSKLHGTTSTAAPPPRSSRSSPPKDTMSVANTSTTTKKGSSSNTRSKKEHQRSSLFSSKSKKEKAKPSGRKRAPSNLSSAPPPGFMIPGPDGQLIYTPISAYQGSMARDPGTLPQPTPPIVSSSEQPAPARRALSDMPGAFPGALPISPHLYRPTTPLEETHPSSRDLAPAFNGLGISTQPSSKRSSKSSKLETTPVEPYQYHNFSSSSSAQSSPKPKYTRRVSSAESSYTAMPRRVPVPPPRPPMQHNYLDASLGPQTVGMRAERFAGVGDEDVMMADVGAQTDSGKSVKTSGKRESWSAGVKEEKRRKSGKGKKKA
ncbi:uncharacterized protein M421DRAFT_4109 [Didymella exigua CBS 183.55]|uniref:Uncharacterized protein n=1 Tax=Didymella exigua CBS 183.55 TaxID=1150837 RepID=A0A6A5RTK2_9PLEO|nr:uncharacterized protein M421DRAFT_4109 [Didymella exigua CBS 183.55]KAF1929656.1 hypothetical protein M421DRAFT_4109 [Didymella exigua CBS 183.55]